MPPNRNGSSQNPVEQEGRIQLAILTYQKRDIPSIRAASRTYSIPYSTSNTRLQWTTIRAKSRADGHKLTEPEEKTLLK